MLSTGEVLACGWAADGQTGANPSMPHPLPTNTVTISVSTAGTGSYSNGQLLQVDLRLHNVSSIATCSDSSFALTGIAVKNVMYGTFTIALIVQIRVRCLRGGIMNIDSWVWLLKSHSWLFLML